MSIASGLAGDIAFGRGQQVVIKQAQGGSWVDHGVINADATVGRLAYVSPYLGAEYAVFQAGTKVWFASSTNGGVAWATQLLVDARESLAEPPLLSAAPYGAEVVFRTADAAWSAQRIGTADALATKQFGPSTGTITAIASYTNLASVVAVQQGAGAALYAFTSSVPLLTYPRPVTRLFMSYPNLYVQLEGGAIDVLLFNQGYRKVQTITNVGAFDAQTTTSFAGSGHVYVATLGSVFAPADPAGDGIDQNCDGSI